jgi:hypothetical protein
MNADTESWDNEGGHIGIAEGGHMSSSSGRVVRVPGAELPYTVILTRLHLVDLSRSFGPCERLRHSFAAIPPSRHQCFRRCTIEPRVRRKCDCRRSPGVCAGHPFVQPAITEV